MIKIQVQYRDMAENLCKSWKWSQNKQPINEVLEMVFSEWQHGSGQESKLFLKFKVRSMMVGDYIQVGGVWCEALGVGWRIDIPWEDMFFEKSKEDFSHDKPELVAWAHKILYTTLRERNNLREIDKISFSA